jgi:hypothetical protein
MTATAFAIEDDVSLPGTPIDGADSTVTNGPGGAQAYPFGNPPDDRMASTQWGAASVTALDPYPPQSVFKQHLFAGWLQLFLGGDETGQFDETDGPAVGGGGPYGNLAANPISVDQDATVDLLATYRVTKVPLPEVPVLNPIFPIFNPNEYIKFLERVLEFGLFLDPQRSSGGVDADQLRIGALTDLFALTRMAAAPENLLKSLTENVETLNATELKQAINSAKIVARRVETATEALEAAKVRGRKPGRT